MKIKKKIPWMCVCCKKLGVVWHMLPEVTDLLMAPETIC